MKKIVLASVLFAALGFGLAGCLKDKGFENHEYGINDPDTQPPGVGFAFGNRSKTDYGLDVSASPQQVENIVFINLFTGTAPTSDVQVTLIDNTTALLTAYNTATGSSILPLPTNLWSVPMTVTIPAGSYNATVPITVSNTTSLNPNLQYAVGLTISAITGGYNIASNLDDLLIVFGVKNKYDGKYTMRGQFYHPSLQPDFGPHVFQVEAHTSGPNSVKIFWPLVGGYNTPLTSGGGPACCFAAQEFGININPSTNAATPVNVAVGATIVYDPILSHAGNTYNNRWDDAQKIFYTAFGYSLSGSGTVIPGVSRGWIDTLIRTGPR